MTRVVFAAFDKSRCSGVGSDADLEASWLIGFTTLCWSLAAGIACGAAHAPTTSETAMVLYGIMVSPQISEIGSVGDVFRDYSRANRMDTPNSFALSDPSTPAKVPTAVLFISTVPAAVLIVPPSKYL